MIISGLAERASISSGNSSTALRRGSDFSFGDQYIAPLSMPKTYDEETTRICTLVCV
jgi:hypothetical protein